MAALRANGIEYEEIGTRHAERDQVAGQFAGVAAFVRHPVDWHASYWAYRNSDHSTWDASWDLDARCASTDWDTYVEAAVRDCPGYVARMFARYTEGGAQKIDFVGKQENLRSDLIKFLNLAGERFDVDAIQSLPIVNSSSNKPVVSENQRLAIYQSEQAMYRRYGYQR